MIDPDVEYLRTRERWTQRMENELIRLINKGERPDIFSWPAFDSPLRNYDPRTKYGPGGSNFRTKHNGQFAKN